MSSNPEIVFRAMREDPNGKPLTGRSARKLGVRICGSHIDIPIRAGKVYPQTGGMSVTPNCVMRLPKSRRPKSLERKNLGNEDISLSKHARRRGI